MLVEGPMQSNESVPLVPLLPTFPLFTCRPSSFHFSVRHSFLPHPPISPYTLAPVCPSLHPHPPILPPSNSGPHQPFQFSSTPPVLYPPKSSSVLSYILIHPSTGRSPILPPAHPRSCPPFHLTLLTHHATHSPMSPSTLASHLSNPSWPLHTFLSEFHPINPSTLAPYHPRPFHSPPTIRPPLRGEWLAVGAG